jgi:hypothetical protein
MRTISDQEIDAVCGGMTNAQLAASLAVGAFVSGAAGVALRFIPGAQLMSAVFTITGMGLGALATALALSDKVVGTAPPPPGTPGCTGDVQCIIINASPSGTGQSVGDVVKQVMWSEGRYSRYSV